MDTLDSTPRSKPCNRCGETKPLAEFHRNAERKDGHRSQCKACVAESQRAYREANKERIADYDRAWRKANKERKAGTNRAYYEANREREAERGRAWREANRERNAERLRAYRQANRERTAERKRAWREANKEREAERQARWRKANPDKRRAARTRYYRLLAEAVQEPYTRAEIFERDGWVCQLCQEPVDPNLVAPDPGSPSLDHVVPLSLGGHDTPANVQLAHFGCNSAKCNRAEGVAS